MKMYKETRTNGEQFTFFLLENAMYFGAFWHKRFSILKNFFHDIKFIFAE